MTSKSSNLAVAAEALTKKFDSVTAIDNLTLTIRKGEVIGLIGPDGAGKTTLLRLLLGLLTLDSGRIQVAGIEVHREPLKLKTLTGYMPQHFSLYGDLSVAENLKFFADLYGIRAVRFQTRKKELLGFSGLAPFQSRLARNLSGGMQKKLALACNLFHTPEILFLDEPTTGVDPISRKELWSLLFQLNKKGTTLVVTTPYMDEAQKCSRVGLMSKGCILALKKPQILIEEMQGEVIEVSPYSPETRKLLETLAGLECIYPYGDTLHLMFRKGQADTAAIRNMLVRKKMKGMSVRKITPSFEDAFLEFTGKTIQEP